MSDTHYDAIVVGLGGIGSAALAEFARRGLSVLGIDQHHLVHDRGSSHGHSRVIRKAYFEHPSYVPLATRAFDLWERLEQESATRLLVRCPCLNVGPEESILIQGVRESARVHDLNVSELSADETRRRYPPFRFPAEYRGLLEHDAGILFVEECVRAQLQHARALDAEFRINEVVAGWREVGDSVEVTTDRTVYRAARLVIAAGPWANRLLGKAGSVLRVMRQIQAWYRPAPIAPYSLGRFPIWLVDGPEGCFYGIPSMEPHGLKAAQHYGAPELTDVEEIDREARPEDGELIGKFLEKYLGMKNAAAGRVEPCIYTLSPDRHFIIDRWLESERVVVAAGFSGHGFKFAPVVGEILADLAMNGTTGHLIDLFRLARFADQF